MNIHGLCIVKNEVDVIEESLKAAAAWCDRIHVFDNGSTDGTWELVRQLATNFPQILPFKQDSVLFSDGLRADIFNEFRRGCGSDDWWCALPADEFYVDNPQVFLRKVPPGDHVVWAASFSYYFTEQDERRYKENPHEFLRTPVQERLRFYLNHWSEPRFFRHGDDIAWSRGDGTWPPRILKRKPYPVRIWVKHYAYRSPLQIDSRLATRKAAIESGTAFSHEAVPDWSAAVSAIRSTRAGFARSSAQFAGVSWQERVVPSQSLDFDGLDGRLVVNEALMPKIGQARPFQVRNLLPAPVRQLARKLRDSAQQQRAAG